MSGIYVWAVFVPAHWAAYWQMRRWQRHGC